MTEQQFSSIEAIESSAEPASELWRNEVQARIAGYKKRRGRRVEGAFSMRFPFPPDEIAAPVDDAEVESATGEPSEIIAEEETTHQAAIERPPFLEVTTSALAATVEEAAAEEKLDAAVECPEAEIEPAAEPEPLAFVDTVSRPRPKRKVIAFPKHLSVAPETVHRLADPVTSESPRILDVPEELEAIPTTPFLEGLQFDPVSAADVSRDREHVELPFRAVGVAQRVFAGLVDVAVAGVGVAIFAAVAFRMLSKPPISKPLVMGLLVAAGLLWSVYQYLFLVYAGTTLGMITAKIRLRTFTGKAPTLRQRRHRVLGFYLSALSLGMGLMWMFVDVDSLCWHDRLSRTYLADRQ
jgi:uncharacterized RDD family membrane protein YckC